MTTRPAPTGAGKSALPAGARHLGGAEVSTHQPCGSFGPGHQIHWIQAKKSREPGQPVVAVKVVAVHDDGRIELEGRDLVITRWHHDVTALRRAGTRAVWRPRFHVLALASGVELNLGAPEEVTPCLPPIHRGPAETVRRYIERAMRENHGYTVPQSWPADLDAFPDGDAGEPKSGVPVGSTDPTAKEKALLRKVSGELGQERASFCRCLLK